MKEGKTMQTVEIVITVRRPRSWKRRAARVWRAVRKRAAKVNWGAVAWYGFLTVAGVVLYKVGAAYALKERGYYAVGGEALALLLPVLWYAVGTTIRDFMRDVRSWW